MRVIRTADIETLIRWRTDPRRLSLFIEDVKKMQPDLVRWIERVFLPYDGMIDLEAVWRDVLGPTLILIQFNLMAHHSDLDMVDGVTPQSFIEEIKCFNAVLSLNISVMTFDSPAIHKDHYYVVLNSLYQILYAVRRATHMFPCRDGGVTSLFPGN